jgi:hypothetical protein
MYYIAWKYVCVCLVSHCIHFFFLYAQPSFNTVELFFLLRHKERRIEYSDSLNTHTYIYILNTHTYIYILEQNESRFIRFWFWFCWSSRIIREVEIWVIPILSFVWYLSDSDFFLWHQNAMQMGRENNSCRSSAIRFRYACVFYTVCAKLCVCVCVCCVCIYI